MNKNVKIDNIMTSIQGYKKNNEQKIRDIIYLVIYVGIIFVVLFSTAKAIKTTNFYRSDLKFRWDNILSYDDRYYIKEIYTSDDDYDGIKNTVVKHPIIKVIGQAFSAVENAMFKNMKPTDRYFHIVIFQLIINLIGLVYLYKILREHLGLRNIFCFFIMTLYELATVTILGTFVLETFIISSTLLIMSYYYLAKQKKVMSIILGVLTTGLTITNCIPFAIMAIILLKNKKDILKVGIPCVVGLGIVFLLLPYKSWIIGNFAQCLSSNSSTFVMDTGFVDVLKMIFYNIIVSPICFISQTVGVKDGLTYMDFNLKASKIVSLSVIIFFAFIVYNVIKNIKDRNMIALLAVFIYNMLLHCVAKFGLYDGTIYGLHFLFAELLMFAFGFKIENKKVRTIFIAFAVIFLLVQLRYNLRGFLEILLKMPEWK